MPKVYRAAIVGLGNIAWRLDRHSGQTDECRTHALSYLRNGRTLLVGGCSPDEKDRNEFKKFFDVPSFSGIEELLGAVRPEIVSICSPSEFHFEQASRCLEEEVPMVWLEKPPAGSLEELDRLIEKQAEYGHKTKIVVNFQRRYAECYRKLRDIFRNRTLGPCVLIQINYSRGLEANGSHMLDILSYVVGDHLNSRLDCVMSCGSPASPSFSLNFEKGPGTIVSGITLPYHCIDISLTCEQGRVSILHGGETILREEKVENKSFPGFYRLEVRESNGLGQKGLQGSMEEALKDLIDSYEKDRVPESHLVSARRTQALMEEIRLRLKGFKA